VVVPTIPGINGLYKPPGWCGHAPVYSGAGAVGMVIGCPGVVVGGTGRHGARCAQAGGLWSIGIYLRTNIDKLIKI
jgi:hypothetical protein